MAKTHDLTERLKAYGPDLLGDVIDPATGSIRFQQTDISLPGNSHLEVALRRTISQSEFYHMQEQTEFGDWQIDVPRIHALHTRGNFSGNRCSNGYVDSFPVFANGRQVVTRFQYSNGVQISIPGVGNAQILELSSKRFTEAVFTAPFPSSATHGTTDGWWFSCIAAIGGGQGFVGHAPNGDVYNFNRVIIRSAKPVIMGTFFPVERFRTILAATRVTDVNGNYVDYAYDSSGRLTRIAGNDGRRIDFQYSGSSGLIRSVTANGRKYSYSYVRSNFHNPTNIGTYHLGSRRYTLSKVTLPDGRSWGFDLSAMEAEAGPGQSCLQPERKLKVTHPSGVNGEFLLSEITQRMSFSAGVDPNRFCDSREIFGAGFINPPSKIKFVKSFAVRTKKISGRSIPDATWTFRYENDVSVSSNLFVRHLCADIARDIAAECTNWTKVQEPNGRHITYYHLWYAEAAGGKLVRRVIREGGEAGPILETADMRYEMEVAYGTTFARFGPSPETINSPARMTSSEISRGADRYLTKFSYVSNHSAPNYSWGNPTRIEASSSLQPAKRVTEITYAHNKSRWILGQPTLIKRNGRTFDQMGYDSLGRMVWFNKFGIRQAIMAYHSDGNLRQYKDALGRETIIDSYYRGIPRRLKRADGRYLHRSVDANGWITSQTNARGVRTGYGYNSMGWLTKIDRPDPWSDTSISYGNLGEPGFFQRIIRGIEETVNWYDGFHRPYLTRTRPLSAGGVTSHTRSRYDALGRMVFQSLPSSSSTASAGIETSYDALGRVTRVRETMSPHATTTTRYLSGNRISVTDPLGHVTTTTRSGYGAPEDGNPILIQQPEGVSTAMTHDIWGNILTARQYGSGGGFSVDQTQRWSYDSRLRVCRHYIPETGSRLYHYDNANQMIAYGEGIGGTSGCAAIPADNRVTLSYDALGRQNLINYPDTTPDIRKTYDANSNITLLQRAGTVKNYSYDSLDHLLSERLAIDGRSYTTQYQYNAHEHLTGRIFPSGRRYDYAPNGLGQPTKVTTGGVNYASNASYHVNGRLKYFRFGISDWSWGDVREFHSTLDARQLPIRYNYTSSAVWDYRYDALRRITGIIDHSHDQGSRNFGYDGLGRLIKADAPELWGSGSYRYDALGNIRGKKLGARIVRMGYDSRNRLIRSEDPSGTGIRSLGYDGRGNVTGLGGMRFAYDLSNQPVMQTGRGPHGKVNARYVYDGHFKRVKQTINGTTVYSVYDASGMLIHRDNAKTRRSTDYLALGNHSVARVERKKRKEQVTYLFTNHQGTPELARTSNGTWRYRDTLTPYGEHYRTEHTASRNHPGFTGHVADFRTGLTYMQARYYDPVIGRFLSNDPVGFVESGFDPAYFNRYAYVHNDPINKVDPDGRIAIGAAKKFIKSTIKHRGNVIEAAVEVGQTAVTVFAPGSTGAERLIAAAELVSPVAPSDIKAAKGALKAAGSKVGGRKGGLNTRAQNQAIGDRVEANGGQVTGGLGRGSESHFSNPNGGAKGGRFSDGSAVDANGNSVQVQTVDTNASGGLTARESSAAQDIANRSGDPVVCVAKENC